jgi:LPXTG-motif cell wall-anchored protein
MRLLTEDAAGVAQELLVSSGMDTNTLLVIVVLVLLFGGGGWYWRGRR